MRRVGPLEQEQGLYHLSKNEIEGRSIWQNTLIDNILGLKLMSMEGSIVINDLVPPIPGTFN